MTLNRVVASHLRLSALVLLALCTSCGLAVARFSGYPGRLIPVTFTNGAVSLRGQLSLPEGSGPFPALVLVHGSGPSAFDGDVSWKAHARAFIQQGFAVLVYDKRGSGGSSGALWNSDYSDLARDVVAGVTMLQHREDIRGDAIGLLGRSEGGWVSVIAAHIEDSTRRATAGATRGIAFVITSSGPAVTPAAQTLYANRIELAAKGASPSIIADANRTLQGVWNFYRLGASDSLFATDLRRDSLRAELGRFKSFASSQMPTDVISYNRLSYAAGARRRFFDPTSLMRTLPCSMLAIFGARDEFIDAGESVALLRAMHDSLGRDITVRVFDGVGHSLLVPRRLIPTYADGYLEEIAEWAHARVPKGPANAHAR